MGAQDLSDLTAASIYGDVTDSQSRMAQRLGRTDEAEALSLIVVDMAEKVLQQRPGDLRAMMNRYYSANMLGNVASDRYDYAKAETFYAKSGEAARNYTLFNPADSVGWTCLIQGNRDLGTTYFEQGRMGDGLRKLREAAALEKDPRNKTGVDGQVFYSWRLIEAISAQKGDLPAARDALAEVHRVAPLIIRDRNFSPELAQITDKIMQVFDYDLLAAEGNFAEIHKRSVALDAEVRKLTVTTGPARDFRNDTLRRNQGWLTESALRTGNYEEAVTLARQTIDQPIAGRLNQVQVEEALIVAKVRLGQALLGAGRRNEALVPLGEAVTYYRARQANGDGSTGFRQDFARALYQMALAQTKDEGGRTERRALLDEALAVLGGLTVEAQQLRASRELIQWVGEARNG
jgi:tetratricopeptide (TPR) repeat protein